MNLLKPKLTHVQDFIISGPSIRTNNKNEGDVQTAKIPQLWQEFHAQHSVRKEPNSFIFGVYSEYESDVNGDYTVTAGIEVHKQDSSSFVVQKGNYLIFENQGSLPAAIIETWQTIWSYFNLQSQFTRTYLTDFEVYRGPEECAVYIGVK